MEECPIQNINMLRLMRYKHRLEELDVAIINLGREINTKIELARNGKIARDEFEDVLEHLREWVVASNQSILEVKDFTNHIIVLEDNGKDEQV